MKNREVYEFGKFRLDPIGKLLYRGEEPLHLTRKAVETLLVLVQNASQVVPKEEILSAVWPGRVVEEANLTQNISVIRKTLSVAAGDPGYIETFPGRGYRLEGPVSQSRVEFAQSAQPALPAQLPLPAEQTPPEKPPQSSRFLAIAASVLALLAFGFLLVWTTGRVLRNHAPSVGGLLPVTRMPGKEFQPAISPDARSLAFLWARSGDSSPRLWIRNLETGEQHEIPSAPGHHSSPCWSPDSKQVAYLRIGPRSTEVLLTRLE